MEKEGKELAERAEKKRVKLEITDRAKDFFARKGYDPKFGARPLSRLIQNEVEDSIADRLLFTQKRPSLLVIDVEEEKIVIKD